MSIEVRLPTVLRPHAGGASSVECDGTTVGEVLASVTTQFPGVAAQLDVSSGELPRFVNVYLNDEDIRYLDKLDTPVAERDVISIMPAVSGG